MGSVATVQPSCKSAVTALEFTQRGHQGYLKMLSTVHKGTEEPAQVKVHCPGWCQLVLLVKIVTVLRAQAGLAVVLCCILGLGAAASTATEVVYRLHCPQQCVCMHGQDKTPSAEISSVNCSARAVHQNNTLLVFSNTQNVTRAADERLNGSSVSIQPRLKFLDLSHNNLSGMSADFFQSEQPLTSVDYLYLNDNAIQALQDASFEHYVGLQFLDLSHNDISMVSERAFEGLENLTWLDLSHNSISALSNSLFHSLINLQSLDLSHNQLQTVNNLQVLSSLEYLYLQHNKLRPVKAANPILLPSMPSLSYLDLSHNPLKITQAGMFETAARLKTLDMSRCSISHLHHQFLAGVPLLTVLRLDENNISSIASPVFQNTSLTSLSLTSMPNLANLSHNTFLGLSKLASLNLSQNQDLSFVHPHLFSPLTHLTQVDLSYCSISLLSQITFHYNLALKEVYLGSNPFACSCANAWLVEKITIGNTSHFKDLDSLTCVNESSGQTEQIAQASFHCEKISLHNITSRVSVPLGGQIMLKCGHSSAGQPGMVKWTTPGGKVLLQHDFHPDAISHLLTQEDVQPDADYHKGHYWHSSSSYYSHLSGREDRVIILADGSLFIDYMLRSDTGPYECQISNAKYNKSATVVLLLDYKVSGEIQIFAIIVGFLCALGFFTLNLIYVIISWIARRLVNKRRREIIRQMLENMNAYKSTQITRIQENYTYQLGRVRNQYHMQRDRLHRNYTQQVTKMKRGCSNQVEKVRENYTSRLAQLRDYSSNQIVQIRERANNQIIRIRDYGTSQLEKLRETYKLQHLHVMKLLDTMNLDNCRHIVETECMRAESMMFDVDLLGEDMRTDSPVSGADSEYTTPDTSPAPSLEVNASQGLSQDMAQQEQPRKKILHPARDSPPILLEMQATINMEAGLALDVADQWEYCSDLGQGKYAPHRYLMNMYIPGKDKNETILQLQSDADIYEKEEDENAADLVKENFPLPTLLLRDDEEKSNSRTLREQDPTQSSPFMTPEASPTKKLQPYRIQSADPQGHDTDVSDETNL